MSEIPNNENLKDFLQNLPSSYECTFVVSHPIEDYTFINGKIESIRNDFVIVLKTFNFEKGVTAIPFDKIKYIDISFK